MKQTIALEFHSKHPPERVWRALTTRDSMAKWLMPNDFEPRLGHRFTLRRPPIPQLNFDGVSHCEVTVLQPPERLEFTWVGGGLDTVVRFRLVAEGQGTHVFFEHAGFDTDHPAQRFAFQNMSGGWKTLGEKVDAAVEALP